MDSSDLLLIDKPSGVTSYDVIRTLKKKYPNKKIGHAGTLDPLATGLLLVGVGSETKTLKEYIGLPKEYIAEVLLGEKRSTGDMEGDVLETVNVGAVDEEQIKEELKSMVGILTLPVSAYSAIKKDGVPFYKRARKAEKTGEIITGVPIRDMEIMEAELLGTQCFGKGCVLTVRFFVGSGTYVRSLAEELGRRLGYPATLKNLRRTKIGEFTVEDAKKLT